VNGEFFVLCARGPVAVKHRNVFFVRYKAHYPSGQAMECYSAHFDAHLLVRPIIDLPGTFEVGAVQLSVIALRDNLHMINLQIILSLHKLV